MKKYLVFAASALALAGCSSDDFVGDSQGNVKESNAAINFSSETGAITRANEVGENAANLLENNFVVVGLKGSETTHANTQVVFDYYNVNYQRGTAGSTVSNTKNWEYVGQDIKVKGTNPASKLAQDANEQTIKYWDYSAASYDFFAFSMGKGYSLNLSSPKSYAKPSSHRPTDEMVRTGAYTLEGDANTLGECYISDMKTVLKAKYKEAVQMQFRHLTSKVRVALYETVPGYVVSDVKFYADGTTTTNTGKATLYGKFNNKGSIDVYFPTTGTANSTNADYNKAHVSFRPEDNATDAYVSSLEFDGVGYNNQKENTISAGSTYLSQTTSTPSYCGKYKKVIPAEKNSGNATLRIDYKLTSTDGSNEVINVKGATAVVPAAYTAWKPGYAYTYIFKISQDTNGDTGETGDPSGLSAISFDAVVLDDEVSGQQTITTVAEPSITTYGFKDKKVTTNGNEYAAGTDIYATVHLPKATVTTTDGNSTTSTWAETDLAPQKLYKVISEDGSIQDITEASVANAIANNGTAEVGNKTLKATGVTDGIEKVSEVPTEGGKSLSVKALKWTGEANTIYAVEYTEDRQNSQEGSDVQHPNYGKKAYKIVIVE